MKRILKNPANLVIMSVMILAMAFTLSCSSGDDDENPSPSNGGGGLSDLPKQVYLDGNEYNGNSDVTLRLSEYDDNENYREVLLSAGNIRNGKIILDLPKNIDSYYVKRFFLHGCTDNYSCDVSYPPNLRVSRWVDDYELRTIISGKECHLMLMASQDEGVAFLYASESWKVKGTYSSDSYTEIYDVDLSKEWNIVYYNRECEVDNYEEKCEQSTSTDSKIIKGELKWQAFCDDD
jgi:hypothetical protein